MIIEEMPTETLPSEKQQRAAASMRHRNRSIPFCLDFINLTGSVNAALMLSVAYLLSEKSDDNGRFVATSEYWKTETSLGRGEQETARRLLRAASDRSVESGGKAFWFEERRGIPAMLHFRVDTRALEAAIGR